jgi:hypothetical protein
MCTLEKQPWTGPNGFPYLASMTSLSEYTSEIASHSPSEIIFAQVLIIFVRFEFVLGEKLTERTGGLDRNRIKGAKAEEVNSVDVG